MLETLVRPLKTIAASLCFVSCQPALADTFDLTVSAPADQLASCMYRRLRDEHPGQVNMVDLSPPGTKEITRSMNGNGWNVFYWRAEIRRVSARTTRVEATASKVLFGPDHEDEVRRTVEACSG
jgi:hypothetical protein